MTHRKREMSTVTLWLGHRVRTHSASWATWTVEFFMLLASLLWAVEANAVPQNEDTSSNTPSVDQVREPAAAPVRAKSPKPQSLRYRLLPPAMSPAGLAGPDFSTSDAKGMFREKRTFLAPEAVTSGQSLSPSFKSNPLYIAPETEILRFHGP